MGDRIEWIDIAKGIGIIMVIYGHTFALRYGYPLSVFRMPLFFFISGLLYKAYEGSLKEYVKSKASAILKPWIKLYVISLFICIMIPEWLGGVSLEGILKDLYSSNAITVQNSSLWYLVCFFFVTILFRFINQINKSLITYASFGIIAILLLKLLPMLPMRLPFKIDTAMIAIVFFAIAVWCKQNIISLIEKKRSFIMVLFYVIISLYLCNFMGWCSLNSLCFGNYPFLFYLLAFTGVFAVCVFSSWLSSSPVIIARKTLSYYGRNSLAIFGFQGLLIRLYLYIFNNIDGLGMSYCGDNPIRHQIGAFVVITFMISPLVVEVLAKLKEHGYKIL